MYTQPDPATAKSTFDVRLLIRSIRTDNEALQIKGYYISVDDVAHTPIYAAAPAAQGRHCTFQPKSSPSLIAREFWGRTRIVVVGLQDNVLAKFLLSPTLETGEKHEFSKDSFHICFDAQLL